MTGLKTFALGALSVLIVGCPMNGDAVGGGESFSATLNGANATTPVTTDANGSAELLFNDDGDELAFELTVTGAEDVTVAHIHMAAAGEDGPVVAFLFESPGDPVTVDTLSAQGVLTAGDLEGPLEGGTLADLRAAISAGNAYVNVHTVVNEAGEIRGQIGSN